MGINERIKSRSITSKASSACKINMGLVMGEADVQASKGFTDYSEMLTKININQQRQLLKVKML